MKKIFYILLLVLMVSTVHSYEEDLFNISSFEPLTKEDSITVRNLMLKIENFIRENEELLINYSNLCSQDVPFYYNIYRLINTNCFKENISSIDSVNAYLKDRFIDELNIESLFDSLLIEDKLEDNYDLFKVKFCDLSKRVSNLFDIDDNILRLTFRITCKIIFAKFRNPLKLGSYVESYIFRYLCFNQVLNEYDYFYEIPENYHEDKFELTITTDIDEIVLYYPLVLDNIYYGEVIIGYDRESCEE